MTLKLTILAAVFAVLSSNAMALNSAGETQDQNEVLSENARSGYYIRLPESASYKDCATAILSERFQAKGITTFKVTSFTTEWSGFLGLGSGFLLVNGTLDPAGRVKVSGQLYTSLEDAYATNSSNGERTNFKMCKLQNVCNSLTMSIDGENYKGQVFDEDTSACLAHKH